MPLRSLWELWEARSWSSRGPRCLQRSSRAHPHRPDSDRIRNLQDCRTANRNFKGWRSKNMELPQVVSSYLGLRRFFLRCLCTFFGPARQQKSYFVQQVHLVDKFKTLPGFVIFWRKCSDKKTCCLFLKYESVTHHEVRSYG